MLLPFIDQARLLDAIRPCESKFTESDFERNTTCPERVYAREGTPMAAAIDDAAMRAAREAKALAEGSGGDGADELSAALLKAPHDNAKLEALARRVFEANSEKIAAALAAAGGGAVNGTEEEGEEDTKSKKKGKKKGKKKKGKKKSAHAAKCWLELQEILWQSTFRAPAAIETERMAGAVARYMREKPLGAGVPLPEGWERLTARLREGPDVGKIKDNRVSLLVLVIVLASARCNERAGRVTASETCRRRRRRRRRRRCRERLRHSHHTAIVTTNTTPNTSKHRPVQRTFSIPNATRTVRPCSPAPRNRRFPRASS